MSTWTWALLLSAVLLAALVWYWSRPEVVESTTPDYTHYPVDLPEIPISSGNDPINDPQAVLDDLLAEQRQAQAQAATYAAARAANMQVGFRNPEETRLDFVRHSMRIDIANFSPTTSYEDTLRFGDKNLCILWAYTPEARAQFGDRSHPEEHELWAARDVD